MARGSVFAAVSLAAFGVGAALGQSESKATPPEFDLASVRPAEHVGLIVNHMPSLNLGLWRNLNFDL
jgi:hypothetical protein